MSEDEKINSVDELFKKFKYSPNQDLTNRIKYVLELLKKSLGDRFVKYGCSEDNTGYYSREHLHSVCCWIYDKDKIIGELKCHYEFIIPYFEKNDMKLYVGVHIEDKNSPEYKYLEKFFEKQKLVKGENIYGFKKEKNGEISNHNLTHFYLNGDGVELQGKSNDDILKEAFEQLEVLDDTVGEDIRYIMNNLDSIKKFDNFTKILKMKKNIILQGAPGTGKTYLAKQIAEAMGAETCFVQFHPSYDYTDFVEGLRPIKTEDSKEIGFERMDGVFKKFCKKALISDNFEEVYKNFIEQLADSPKKYETPSLGNQFEIQINGKDNIYAIPQTDTQSQISITKESLSTYLRTGLVVNWKPYITVLGEELRNLGYKKKNCVFIIDEINRGEMSKIFGELFFSIDPGYRGEKGKISTQYQNLVDEDDAFYDGFYVPENVYIIGTMNDIDRNVESMDFAIRRRFAFMEITAEKTQGMLDNPESWNDNKPSDEIIKAMKNRMTNLNKAIWNEKENKGIDGLSSAYHIGASYFLKYNDSAEQKDNETETPFDNLWKYHLKPLLQEYLRGMEDADNKLKALKAAYDNDKQ